MPFVGSSILGSNANTTVTIFNKSVPTASTEESQTLPANTKEFILRVRGNKANLQLAYTATESGSKFITVRKGAVYKDSNFYTGQTIYFQTDVGSQTVEIIAFS